MTPDPTLLDLADEMEALAARLRELFHVAADRELAEMDRQLDEDVLKAMDRFPVEPDWEAMHERRMEHRMRAHIERTEDMGVEGW